MGFRAEDIILQPLWKIHNIDWSDRRNVFETYTTRPSLDLLRRNTVTLNRYDVVGQDHSTTHPATLAKRADHSKRVLTSDTFCTPLRVKWSAFSVDTVRTAA